MIESVAAASPTTIRMSGPLIRMPAASAVQNTASSRQSRRRIAATRREIDARQHAHGDHDGEQQHGVGLGQARLDAEDRRRRHHQSGQKRAAPADEGERAPIGRQNGADRSEQRRHAVEPDGRVGVGKSERARRLHHGSLQPIDADRLSVAHVVLVADVDIVAGFDHLLGGLREIGLVAIDRRNLKKSRQEGEQRHEDQHRRRPPVRSRGIIEQRGKALGRPVGPRCRAAGRAHVVAAADGFGMGS